MQGHVRSLAQELHAGQSLPPTDWLACWTAAQSTAVLHRGYDLRGQPQVELTLEAVIVGVLLFTPLLLLLPTGAVFYALLAGLHLAASSVRLAMAASALLAARGPVAAVAVRLAGPGLFPGEPWSFRMMLA